MKLNKLLRRSAEKSWLIAALILMLWGCQSASISKNSPTINDPKVVGIYPESPFLFAIPTTGERPITWSATGLPEGLNLDPATGIITGSIAEAGEYAVELSAKNAYGTAESTLKIKAGDLLALTPPMGWNSWNTFADQISEELVKQVVDSMVAIGMKDLGYQYINIDDFWQLAQRDDNGRIQVDKSKFPNGIKAVADYVHAKGLKLGIYSDASPATCGGVAGSYGYEEQDAQDFADWGVDLLKYDYCYAPASRDTAIVRYGTMYQALKKTGRSIVFSVCEWGPRQPWEWAAGVGGNYWRTTWDIRNTWINDTYDNQHNSIMQILDINSPLDEYAGPGHWNDPDMLVVGIDPTAKTVVAHGEAKGCSDTEYRSHMSLWSLMAAPLLSGNDVRGMNDATKTILMNSELIAINQDELGKQAKKVRDDGDIEVFVKPLYNGDVAVGLLNRKDSEDASIAVSWEELGLSGTLEFRDVWSHEVAGEFAGQFETTVKPHECKVYRVSAKN